MAIESDNGIVRSPEREYACGHLERGIFPGATRNDHSSCRVSASDFSILTTSEAKKRQNVSLAAQAGFMAVYVISRELPACFGR